MNLQSPLQNHERGNVFVAKTELDVTCTHVEVEISVKFVVNRFEEWIHMFVSCRLQNQTKSIISAVCPRARQRVDANMNIAVGSKIRGQLRQEKSPLTMASWMSNWIDSIIRGLYPESSISGHPYAAEELLHLTGILVLCASSILQKLSVRWYWDISVLLATNVTSLPSKEHDADEHLQMTNGSLHKIINLLNIESIWDRRWRKGRRGKYWLSRFGCEKRRWERCEVQLEKRCDRQNTERHLLVIKTSSSTFATISKLYGKL